MYIDPRVEDQSRHLLDTPTDTETETGDNIMAMEREKALEMALAAIDKQMS